MPRGSRCVPRSRWRCRTATAPRRSWPRSDTAPAFRYQKFREVWEWKDAEIDVDETPLGTFLEIEGPTETIQEAARVLGVGPEDYVLESYPALFRAAGGRGDMVF